MKLTESDLMALLIRADVSEAEAQAAHKVLRVLLSAGISPVAAMDSLLRYDVQPAYLGERRAFLRKFRKRSMRLVKGGRFETGGSRPCQS